VAAEHLITSTLPARRSSPEGSWAKMPNLLRTLEIDVVARLNDPATVVWLERASRALQTTSGDFGAG
jgi:hypothetical protein